MNKMKKVLALALVCCMALSLVACNKNDSQSSSGLDVTVEQKDHYNIGIIQQMNHVALDKAREGFVDALAAGGFVDGENITIDSQNAQGDPNNMSSIADRFVGNKCDLVLAIATTAAQTMAGKTKDMPILATAVTDFADAGLVKDNANPQTNVSGTTDMNPIEDQIELMLKLVPDVHTVGFLYTSSEDNSALQCDIAKEVLKAKGIEWTEVTVSNTNDVQQATQQIVTECDAIYIPTDNTFASAMPIVYGVTKESKTPVICGEAGMVETGGLATMSIDYYQLGYQAGEMAVRILKDGADVSTMPIESAKELTYCINGNVAKEIGLSIPDDLQEYVITPEQ